MSLEDLVNKLQLNNDRPDCEACHIENSDRFVKSMPAHTCGKEGHRYDIHQEKKQFANGASSIPKTFGEIWSRQTVSVVNSLVDTCHGASRAAGWYNDPETGEPLTRNLGEMLMLMVSEISECMEGERKDLMDDKIPNRKMAEVELADAVIRICDYAGYRGYDLGGAIIEKLAFNRTRADHKPENRIKDNGKKF